MDIRRLKLILEYGRENRNMIQTMVNRFYLDTGLDQGQEIRSLRQTVQDLLQEKAYIIVELPFKDKEIGAVSYRGDGLGYTFLNSSLPKVNVNFALSHEIYHVCYEERRERKQFELYLNEHYHEYDSEYAANLFAGMLLMPEKRFRTMFYRFQAERKGTLNEEHSVSVIVRLMNYFEVPYMAVLIRCYELQLLEGGGLLEELLQVSDAEIHSHFMKLWLDESILQATGRDDYNLFEQFVMYFGVNYLEDGYISQRTLEKALKNMRRFYLEIREEQ